ncbi:OmpH family outer membrane protein [bacterium]|nr:OmpH family outer membrane protein [bacterium]
MKKTLLTIIFAVLLLAAVAQAADGDPLNIAYVDLQRIQDEWVLFQEFLQDMEQEVRDKENEVQPQLDEYTTQILELQQKLGTPISDERRMEIEVEIQTLYDEAMRLQESAISVLEAREQQQVTKLVEKIYEAIETLGEDTEYDYILDQTSLIYAKEELDITEDIIVALNTAAGAD